MASLLAQSVIAMLERAEESEIGIIMPVHVRPGFDVTQPIFRAKQLFYRVRADLAPRFDNLQIIFAPDDPDGKLWLIKRSEVSSSQEAS